MHYNLARVSLLLLLCSILSLPAHAQESAEESMTFISALLDKFESSESLHMQYDLNYSIPGQDTEILEGEYFKVASKSAIKLPHSHIFTDPESTFSVDLESNVINITDTDGENLFLSPEGFLNEVVNSEYKSTVRENIEAGTVELVFVPKLEYRKRNEYTKIRLVLDAESKMPREFFLLEKNGYRLLIEVNDIDLNSEIPMESYTFVKENYPGYSTEDLRF